MPDGIPSLVDVGMSLQLGARQVGALRHEASHNAHSSARVWGHAIQLEARAGRQRHRFHEGLPYVPQRAQRGVELLEIDVQALPDAGACHGLIGAEDEELHDAAR